MRAVTLRRVLASTLLFPLAACAAAPAPKASPTAPALASSVAPASAPPVEITLVGTSDLHGRLATLPLLGGYLSVLRARNPGGVVLVDAGDMFQGTLESNSNEGGAVIEAYKKLG